MPLSNALAEAHSSGVFTSSQEQATRSLLKFHMGYSLYHPVERKDKVNINIIVSGMEGDLNDLALGSVGLLCGHYGFHYTYLGADISYEALSDTIKSLEANVVIVGPSNTHNQLGKSHFQNYIEKLSGRIGPSTEIIVAGRSELDLNKIPSKGLMILKTLDAVDDYLSRKNH